MAGDPDDVFDADDPIDGERARVEARFRELERDEELRRMRGGPAPDAAAAGSGEPGADDLAGMKAALGGEDERAADPGERYVVLLCPSCAAKNRTSLTRVRHSLPRCGACKKPLWFS